MAAALEERERKGSEVGLVVKSGSEENGARCEAGEVSLLILVQLIIMTPDVQVLHVVIRCRCGPGTEMLA